MATLSDADIRHRLMLLRFDPEFHGEDQRVPIHTLARTVGLSRQSLYKLMNNPEAGLRDGTRERLNHMFNLIDNGMRFVRRNRTWEAKMPDGSDPPGFAMKGKTHHGVAHLLLP